MKRERDELFDDVIVQWELAINSLYKNKKVNVAFLANTSEHLHAHLIPRFGQDEFEKYEIVFKDPNPTGNYAPYPKKEIPLDILLTIKSDILSVIKKNIVFIR
ncbi:hypothetical protein COU57_01410 [Candidatus Pacearchaeota archaeon CG10_big_fil_rev_8_21_14_0_10_32_14]|nr:MAG: hypothetical protein COU57_01410 [Candidatus Pacearchaeota archaeon CG10_big_fil_rev_8_21_14_0_10_32_14]